MTLKLVPPAASRNSHVKAGALLAFRLVRSVQAKASQIPGALARTRDDIASAWRESADSLPNA